MLTLRPYQRAALNALYKYWEHGGGNGILVLPTGAGKSLCLAAICQEMLAQYPSLRICIVSHIRELLTQNYQELLRLYPEAPAGLYSAGIGRRDANTQILICGIQSVWNKTKQIGAFDILLIDEVHLVSKNNQTMYGKFIAALKADTPDMRLVGLSASPWRLDSGRLDRGKDRIFDKIVFEANIRELIDQNYLSPLISKATATMLDVSKVQKRGGEYIPGQLEVAVDVDWIVKAAAKEMVQFGQDRKAWLAFCSGVKHAGHMRDAIRELGFSCEVVTGETGKADRDRIISQFKAGKIRCMTSVGVIATGFNSPNVDIRLRCLGPHNRLAFFFNNVDAGLRKYPGKENCLVLDFANMVKTHGPIDTITVNSASSKDRPPGEALAKECPNCGSLVALASQICPDCGHQFPLRDEPPKHEATADATTSILSRGQAQWVDVDKVTYYPHNKPGSPTSMRVEYSCGFVQHKEWVCLNHQGLARSKAEQWWQRVAGTNIPRTTDEALRRVGELKVPVQIQVRPSGKYFEVCGRRFKAVKEAAE